MNFKLSFLCLGLMAMIFTCLAFDSVQAAEFSADLIFTKGEICDTLELYVSGNTYRLEIPEDDGKTVMIRKRGSTYILNSDSGLFRKLTWLEENDQNPVAALENKSYDMKAVQAGEETIDGYQCTRYDYSYPESDKIVFQRWLAAKLEFVISQALTEDDIITRTELININETQQDKLLFEIPESGENK